MKISVSSSDELKRLDSFLSQRLVQFSRTNIQKMISNGSILVNKKEVKKNFRLTYSDQIEIDLSNKADQKKFLLNKWDYPLEILYQDKDFAIINKPRGVIVHPAPGNYDRTLVNILLHKFEKELNNAINKNVPAVMDNIDKMNKRLGNKLDWGQVNDMANKIEEKYGNKPDPSIDAHNKRLIKIAVIICGGLLLILIGAIVYFTVYKKMDIGLGTILLQNFVIAVLIGIIEAVFFLNVALKYSPVTTSDMMNQIIDRTEYHINEQLEQ